MCWVKSSSRGWPLYVVVDQVTCLSRISIHIVQDLFDQYYPTPTPSSPPPVNFCIPPTLPFNKLLMWHLSEPSPIFLSNYATTVFQFVFVMFLQLTVHLYLCLLCLSAVSEHMTMAFRDYDMKTKKETHLIYINTSWYYWPSKETHTYS